MITKFYACIKDFMQIKFLISKKNSSLNVFFLIHQPALLLLVLPSDFQMRQHLKKRHAPASLSPNQSVGRLVGHIVVLKLGMPPKKKLLRRRHCSILIYPPPSQPEWDNRNGNIRNCSLTPSPPSCNRDKLQFSGGELMNTI